MLKKILLIDDELDIIELIPMLDKTKEREYEMCQDSEAALEKIVNGGFDLIISDISMPKLDGIKLAERLRAQSLNIPIIFFTGHLLEDIKIKVKHINNCTVFLKTNINDISIHLSYELARAA